MKRIIALALTACLLLSSCGVPSAQTDPAPSQTAEQTAAPTIAPTVEPTVAAEPLVEFTQLSDPNLLPYLEDTLYESLVTTLDSEDYFVENVSAVYYSKEYMEEVAYNSQENIYFGYTLSELDEQFEGTRYVFTMDESGQTVAQPFEAYDGTYDQIISNVVTGSGVILVCVTVSVATAGSAPAVSSILAFSAQTGAKYALSGAAFGGIVAGACTGMMTGDMDEALKAAALAGSDGFKWGAITGGIAGGVGQAVALKGATLGGLTINQAAKIQKESKYPLEVIKSFHSYDEYLIYKEAKLVPLKVNGQYALVRKIDLDYYDEASKMTNRELIANNRSPIGMDGKSMELHHIGQEESSPLAFLTATEHRKNAGVLNIPGKEGRIANTDKGAWIKQRNDIWTDYVKLVDKGLI